MAPEQLVHRAFSAGADQDQIILFGRLANALANGWRGDQFRHDAIFAIDELTGLVATSALVRPTKSVMDMKAKSVKKKWKDKRFAAGVNRSIIQTGAEMLGVDSGLGYFILDARDRFAYDELIAAVIAIGLLGRAKRGEDAEELSVVHVEDRR